MISVWMEYVSFERMIIKNVIKVAKYVSQTSHFRDRFQRENNFKTSRHFIRRYLAYAVGQLVEIFYININLVEIIISSFICCRNQML
jgi:hypothetical protein